MNLKRVVVAILGVCGIVVVGGLARVEVQVGAQVGAQVTRSIWDGVYTSEQAERGGQLYETWCGLCHGGELEGGETAPALAGGEFMWAWNGLSVGDLFERLRVSMPEGNPGDMSRSQKADVLAFLLARNDVPNGAEELRDRTPLLKPISFDALRPQ